MIEVFQFMSGLLPYYFLEKNLYRSTVIHANRRIAPVRVIKMENAEYGVFSRSYGMRWRRLGMGIDEDPSGGVVVTGQNVQVEEFGGDHNWRLFEITSDTNAEKMKAMGINEAFLSGDITYNNLEHAIHIMLDINSAKRNQFEHNVFLFSTISAY